ncbi:MAG: hypothetical protein E6G79_02410 [Alphaproteobacteria bacterium]|nr:MAG: hypothetical protein E6G79_02410 [Alphaproteobacteria bacterium]
MTMALSQAQVDAINSAIDATQAYADQLQAALGKASAQGNFNAAAAISSRFDDAQALESKLAGLLVQSIASDLTQAIQAIRHTTDTLNQQKQDIDNVVAGFATAGEIVQDISGIASAVAAI